MADKEKKTKQPGAKKRILQSRRRNLLNRVTKSRAKTAVRALNETVQGGDQKAVQEHLNAVFSFVDKAVKKGVYHRNKGARIKSRLVRKSTTATSA